MTEDGDEFQDAVDKRASTPYGHQRYCCSDGVKECNHAGILNALSTLAEPLVKHKQKSHI